MSDPLAALVSHLAEAVASRVNSPDELVALPGVLEKAACMKLVADGTLPAAKIGRRWYARRSDVLALVDRLRPIPKPKGLADADVAEHAKNVAREYQHGTKANRHRRAAA